MKAIPKEWIISLDKSYQMPEDFNTDQPQVYMYLN